MSGWKTLACPLLCKQLRSFTREWKEKLYKESLWWSFTVKHCMKDAYGERWWRCVKGETSPSFHCNKLGNSRLESCWKRETFNAYSLKKTSWSDGEINLIVWQNQVDCTVKSTWLQSILAEGRTGRANGLPTGRHATIGCFTVSAVCKFRWRGDGHKPVRQPLSGSRVRRFRFTRAPLPVHACATSGSRVRRFRFTRAPLPIYVCRPDIVFFTWSFSNSISQTSFICDCLIHKQMGDQRFFWWTSSDLNAQQPFFQCLSFRPNACCLYDAFLQSLFSLGDRRRRNA